MKNFGESAIHDQGFQFYLTLNVKFYINTLIETINCLEKCLNTHMEWKKETWHTSKTKAYTHAFILDLPEELTLSECNKLLAQKRKEYKTIMGIAEEALLDAKEKSKNNDEFGQPYINDKDRQFVLVEEQENK